MIERIIPAIERQLNLILSDFNSITLIDHCVRKLLCIGCGFLDSVSTGIGDRSTLERMYSFMRELIYPFVTPMGLFAGAFVVSILLMVRFRKLALALIVVSTLALLALSTKLVGHHLYSRLEKVHPPVAIETFASADYIVLLGGSLGVPESPRVALEFGMIGDRLLQAKRLYEADKAPKIVVVGGNAEPEHNVRTEAFYMAELLIEMGVPRADLIFEDQSRDTRENASLTAALFENAAELDIILVTSAFHMPRAYRLFSDAGFGSVVPASADIYIPDRKGRLWTRLIPSSTGIALSSNAIHNMIGDWVNRFLRESAEAETAQ